jgi:hypothetical protein
MKCEICNEEMKDDIKNYHSLLICKKCRDEQEETLEEDNKFCEDYDL